MLTNVYPFADSTHADWYATLCAGRFTPPEEHVPAAPRGWGAFFERALSPASEQRPQSASEFLAWFGNAVSY
jgi:hypothetical protein